jgi:hypothetical protein
MDTDTDSDMDAPEPEPPIDRPRRRSRGWTYLGLAAIFLLAACFSASLALITNWSIHRGPKTTAAEPVATIVVDAPQSISGPALAMALPKGCTFMTKQVDADGGNWWFTSSSPHPLRVLIATSRLETSSHLSDDYFQHVVGVVEQAAGDQIIGDATVQANNIGNYAGERGGYDLYSPEAGHQHAEALLVRREHDDLFIVIYGDFASRQQLQTAAQKIFGSLIVDPTPPAYDLHSV